MSGSGAPLIPEIGILAMPYHHFGTRWMTPHHLMTRLANYFNVLWLEPAHHWRTVNSQQGRRLEIQRLLKTLPEGFDVYMPETWLFDIYRPAWLRRQLFDARLRRAWTRLRRRGALTTILHLWHYQFENALKAGGYDLSLYHIDDEYSFTPDPPDMDPAERRVIAAANQVFAISPGLMERKGGINRRLDFAPEGVDFTLYSTPVPEPADIARIPHPRIGYTGNLKVQLDWELLLNLARRHPEWSLVFVGPKSTEVQCNGAMQELESLANVHLLGPKTVRDLAAYPQHFDVCTMPYLVTGYTNNIYPLKLHEYLASSRPVVGTPIRSLQDFRSVITLATSVDEWSQALKTGLESSAMSTARVSARQNVARKHDWSELTFDVARIICEHLGPPYASRLEKLAVHTPVLAP